MTLMPILNKIFRGIISMKQRLFSVCVLGCLALSAQWAAATTNVNVECKLAEISAELWTPVAKQAFSRRPDVAFDGEADKLAELQRAKVDKLNFAGIRGGRVGEPPSRNEVTLIVLVESDGKVSDFAIQKKSKRALFNDVAESVALDSSYSPAMLRGAAVPSIASFNCTFDVK